MADSVRSYAQEMKMITAIAYLRVMDDLLRRKFRFETRKWAQATEIHRIQGTKKKHSEVNLGETNSQRSIQIVFRPLSYSEN